MEHLTIRGLPPDLAKALDQERKRRGWSLNQTVKELLRRSLGLADAPTGDNGLKKLAGRWSRRDFDEFECATAHLGKVDAELWR